MESLRSMFPEMDPGTLQATLEAHDNSVERTVDYLLASSAATQAPSARERAHQVEQDARLAARLQAEQDGAHLGGGGGHGAPAPGPNVAHARNGPAQQGFQLPSLGDVQNAVKPIVDGVQYAGRVAAESVSSLYREFVGDGREHAGGYSRVREEREDEAVVLRGEAGSPAAARGTRLRRPVPGAAASAASGKKDS